MQPAKSTKYLCLFLCGICSDYTLQNQGLCGLLWPGLSGVETIPQKQRGRLCCRPLPVASLFRLCRIGKQHLLKGSWSENFSLWKTPRQPFPIESAMFALRISDFPFAVVSDLLFSVLLPFRKVQGKAECSFSAVLREVRFSFRLQVCQS